MMDTQKCQACGINDLPEEPAVVILNENRFLMCDECERLMKVIQEKSEELLAKRAKKHEQSL